MPQLSDHQRVLLQAEYKVLFRTFSRSLGIKSLAYQLRKRLNPKDFDGRIPHFMTVLRWVTRFEENDGQFIVEDKYKGNKNAQKCDAAVDESVKARLLKTPSVRDATYFQYWNQRTGKNVTLRSPQTIANSRKRTLDIAEPKNDEIVLTPHHKRMRLDKAEMEVTKNDEHIEHKVQADESGWGFAMRLNARNDSIYCEKGQAAESNKSNVSSYMMRPELNTYVAIYEGGVLYHHIWPGEFTIDYYRDVILPELKPRIDYLKLHGRFSVYEHDHCGKGGKPIDKLNWCFGENKWGQTPPPPCKTRVGDRVIRTKPGIRRAHNRIIGVYEYNEECDCVLEDVMYPAKFEDMNITEHFFSEMESKLKNIQRDGGICHSREELKARLEKVIREIDIDKHWFRHRFSKLRQRYLAVITAEGGRTKY